MSYSVESKCNRCVTRELCTDVDIIEGAVSTIHSITFEKGHKGAGMIVLDCQNFNEQE